MKKFLLCVLLSFLFCGTALFATGCTEWDGFPSAIPSASVADTGTPSVEPSVEESVTPTVEPSVEPSAELIIQPVPSDKILIVESRANTSADVLSLLEGVPNLSVTVTNPSEEAFEYLSTGLKTFDLVVFNNLSPTDMPSGFEARLDEYVKEGGNLLTFGGDDENGDPHAYSRTEIFGTAYGEMLPVQITENTLPKGVVVILDTSGSMAYSENGQPSAVDYQKQGVLTMLDSLQDNDYLGVISLADAFGAELPLTPCRYREEIKNTVNAIESTGGGTILSCALEFAYRSLSAIENVAYRHVVIMTDGEFADSKEEYLPFVQQSFEAGVTVSVIGINASSTAAEGLSRIVETGGGELSLITDLYQIGEKLRNDVLRPELTDLPADYAFFPKVSNAEDRLFEGITVEANALKSVVLHGVYGGVTKETAQTVLADPYGNPVYAEWNYGNGKVGTFLCDLQSSTWSSDMLSSEDGIRLIQNIIRSFLQA